jgi:hypothetical protein
VKRRIIVVQFIGILLLGCFNLQAQNNTGKVSGKLTDKKTGELLIGVTVLVQGTGKGAVTDVEGRYLLPLAPGTYTLDFKYMGYATKSISEVVVKDGEVTALNVALDEPKSKELKEVVIRGSYKQETINALYVAQKNNPSISSGISGESIRRSPDRNTSEALKRVSGASIQDNKYIIVRGLSDRYNTATINNAILPSTEPDRKTFSFDIIPSNLIDNIVINKTASPEMPGEFAGGLVQVYTKDIPTENYLGISIGYGYNTQSTFKDTKGMERGKNDWLGFDDGSRELPASFPSSRSKYAVLSQEQQLAITKDFRNNFATENFGAALPSQSYQLTWGNRVRLKKDGSFGSIISLTYRNAESIQPGMRYDYDFTKAAGYRFTDNFYKYNTSLGAIANFTYVKRNNKISFKNIFNRILDNNFTDRAGTNYDNNLDQLVTSQELVMKTLVNSQLEGNHKINRQGWKLDWNLNYSLIDRNQPDMKILSYARSIGTNDPYEAQVPFGSASRQASRFYSLLTEDNFGGAASLTVPFSIANEKQSVKIGGQKLFRQRDFSARVLGYKWANYSGYNQELKYLPADQLFAGENIVSNGFIMDEITNNSDKYAAESDLMAGYAQFDNKIGDKWRIVWGVRGESYYQYIKTANATGKTIRKDVTYFDFLPSGNLSYALNEKSNLRVSASKTVSRPELRELSNFVYYDFVTYSTVQGNPDLKRASITNLDFRYELYPGVGEAITGSVFYKQFKNAIEQYVDPGGTPNRRALRFRNAPSATALGFELEARKKLDFISSEPFFERTTAFANVSYIYSTVDLQGYTSDGNARALQGQSPYLINAGVQYATDGNDLVLGVLYNRIGPRIYLVGLKGYPDIYENGRNILDFQIAKKVIKKQGELRLNVSDLLNNEAIFYQNPDGASRKTYKKNSDDNVISTMKYGTNISLTFSYQFGLGKKK